MELLLQARIRGCDRQSRRSALRHIVGDWRPSFWRLSQSEEQRDGHRRGSTELAEVRRRSQSPGLRVPVSLRVCTLSRRTFMNNAGKQVSITSRCAQKTRLNSCARDIGLPAASVYVPSEEHGARQVQTRTDIGHEWADSLDGLRWSRYPTMIPLPPSPTMKVSGESDAWRGKPRRCASHSVGA
jgi:hypothetical protein